jgi:hypothetical protein
MCSRRQQLGYQACVNGVVMKHAESFDDCLTVLGAVTEALMRTMY